MGQPKTAKPLEQHRSMSFDDNEMLVMLMNENPIVVSCLRTIQASCLDQGIQCTIGGQPASSDFLKFIRTHYNGFCEQAIRCIFMCGFVPWRLRRLETGDCAPEVLPLGTFSWTVIENPAKKRQSNAWDRSAQERVERAPVATKPDNKRKQPEDGQGTQKEPVEQPSVYLRQQAALKRHGTIRNNDDSKSLRYKLDITHNIGSTVHEIEIYEYFQPVHMTPGSVVSPMSSIMSLYREILFYRDVYKHAETWNTQAKLLCSYTSSKDTYSVMEGNPIISDWDYPQKLGLTTDTNLPTELDDNMATRDLITESLVGSKSTLHTPLVYSLPKNTVLQATPKLDCIRKLEDMEHRFTLAVSNLMGVPMHSETRDSTTAAFEGNQRVFSSMVRNICHHLQEILWQVYVASYGNGSQVRFTLSPSSRLSVQDIDDFLKLMDYGLVSVDDAHTIGNAMISSEIILSGGKPEGAGKKNLKMFETPKNAVERQNIEATTKKVDNDIKKLASTGAKS